MSKESYKPNSLLSKYIDRIYTFKKSDDQLFTIPPIISGTGLELVFHLNKPLSIDNNLLESGHILCPREKIQFNSTKVVSFISVRFKSGAFRHFTPIPFSDLNNTNLSIEDIWGKLGKDLNNQLEEQIEIVDKIKTIEQFLWKVFNNNKKENNFKWDPIIHQLYYHFNSKKIMEISKSSKLSLRQFERNFKTQFGVTPKSFQKTARFQKTLKTILLHKKTDYLSIALDHGYFDQSHFINEFKSFTNQKPKDYLNHSNFNNHFYYKSIK